ncbi:MAG: efflux RND transporter permease subunit [Coxiellaceae bacterium]|nr:efflux RND transporter permease subunit [Coxiellaceae bacterium]
MSNRKRKFTDLFIERPVLAVVISLLILLVGLRSMQSMQLREFPQLTNTVITVTTAYPGASAELMQGFITQRIAKSISSSEGLDYISSTSTDGLSTVEANIRLNYDPEKAFTNVMSKVSEVEGDLPTAAQKPVITKTTGSKTALMYLAYQSSVMSPQQVTNYISRVVQPVFATVPGVAQVQLLGGGYTYAMRIWLSTDRMAALGVTPEDVTVALKRNNFQSAAGNTKGKYITVSIRAMTDLQSVKEFKNIVVKSKNNNLVHLGDIAKVKLGQESYDGYATYNGKLAVYVAIMPTPTANPLTVIKNARKILGQLKSDYPPGLQSHVVFDATQYIHESLVEVIRTIIEATLIVILVIYLFLGSIRSVLIPVVTIPLSLIGVMTIMLALGYSLNLLTLLAMVLAIGLVVDDAIVVVENVHRHIELGKAPFKAAIEGAREIATPVIAMTITLAAVYAPIGFMTGLTGDLFVQFAFTLAATVIVSGIIALTLSPMMCSKLLRNDASNGRYALWLDRKMDHMMASYQRVLRGVLMHRGAVLLMGVIVLICCYVFYALTPEQLAPQEDQGMIWMMANGPQYANIDYTTKFSNMLGPVIAKNKNSAMYFIINGADGGPNSVIGGVRLKTWSQRDDSESEVLQQLQSKLQQNPGLRVNLFEPPALPMGGNFFPIDFVIKSTGDFKQLYKISEELLTKARKSGYFLFLQNSLQFNKPQVVFHINRNKAAQMGIDMQTIGGSLASAMSENYVNRFSMLDQSFKVIPQLERKYRRNAKQLDSLYLKNTKGDMVPLSAFSTIQREVEPSSLMQFQQLNAVELQGMMFPPKTTMDGLNYLKTEAMKILPSGMSIDYSGKSRTSIQEGNKMTMMLFFSIIVIYLVLAAQFESFSDPITILVSVLMAFFGALIPLFLGAATLNLYTKIGLITLIGLISKHGILMVDFANHLQMQEGLSKLEAIVKAAAIRLRPILMTTVAMIAGVIPLIIASGAGAVSRQNIGTVIACGMFIGTAFTLFVVPTMYTLLARDHKQARGQAEVHSDSTT